MTLTLHTPHLSVDNAHIWYPTESSEKHGIEFVLGCCSVILHLLLCQLDRCVWTVQIMQSIAAEIARRWHITVKAVVAFVISM